MVGYVSQFLRVIPRVSALDIVAAAAQEAGLDRDAAHARAAALLARLRLPERLWRLPPATFSGGEQQRVNIARGFAGAHRLLVLDEPTASLDADNREAVIALIAERKARGRGLPRHLPRRRRARARRRPRRRRVALFRPRGRMSAPVLRPSRATRLSEDAARPSDRRRPRQRARPLCRDRRALRRRRDPCRRLFLSDAGLRDLGGADRQVRQCRLARAHQRDQSSDLARDAASFHLSRQRLLARRRARGRLLRLAARKCGRRSATTSGSATARRSPPASPSATAR